MKIDVREQRENKLLKRKEIIAYVEHGGATPKIGDVRQALVEKLGVKPELLVVLKVAQEAGKKEAKVFARVYSDKDGMFKTEPNHILVRNKLAEKKPKKEKAKKGKPAEAPKK
ncbi:MAG: 30S ribosomal protein S24e [Candidatus Anstonellales archaeon]